MKDDFYGYAYEDVPRKAALQTLERALIVAARYTIEKVFSQFTSTPVLDAIKENIAKSVDEIAKGKHPQVVREGKKLIKLNRHNRRRLAALKTKREREGKKK